MVFKNIIPFILISASIIYPQQNREEALKKGGWSGGLAGWLGWENFNVTGNSDTLSSKSKVDGFNFIFSSRNGSIVETNGVFGFDLQWREKTRTTKADPNPDNTSEYIRDRVWFIGLWARYYIPLEGNLALYFEGSGGYAVFSQKNEILSSFEFAKDNSEAFANGFAYNAGIGFAHFVTKDVAFEVTGRWEGGSLNGESENYNGTIQDLNVKLGNIFILFGFQVYLR